MSGVYVGLGARSSRATANSATWSAFLLQIAPFLFSTVMACLLALLVLPGARVAHAQDPSPAQALVNLGDALVTGFSGVREADGISETGKTDIKRLLIDPDGSSLRGFDLSNPGAEGPLGQPLAPEFLSVTAREIGQVLGISLDDATDQTTQLLAPNIYVTATSAYGLPIMGPDKDADGSPDRLTAGTADAMWMEGLFGLEKGGGPGSVWKIDGLTGEVTLFANITHDKKPNSGAALGNIAFDAQNKQLFVSERDTGLIHRLDLIGNLVEAFDHGMAGRTAIGLEAVPLDGDNRANITSKTFKANDPSTWGLADPKRLVWGLAVHEGRLYYAVAEGPQIWSVGLKDDGSFGAASTRWELDLPDDVESHEIADIAFTRTGQMILAQRTPVSDTSDFRELIKQGDARLLRYQHESPDDPSTKSRWVSAPDEYALGLTGDHRSATGGVALGYGYGQDGTIDPKACEANLWATGDGLRENPLKTITVQDKPRAGLADGFQGTPADMVRPANVPPTGSFVINYDGRYPEMMESGHVGDIEIASQCPGEAGAPSAEPGVAPPEAPLPAETGVAPPGPPGVPQGPPAPQEADLSIGKRLTGPCQQGQDCPFEIVVTNQGPAEYQGPLILSDTLSVPGVTLAADASAPWNCRQEGNHISCNHPTLLLKPGHSASLPLTLRDPGDPNIKSWENCVDLTWLGAAAVSPGSIRAVQTELAALGYYTGPIYGIADSGTKKAISDLEKASGLPETGKITPEFLDWIFGPGASTATDPDAGNDRACAKVETETPPSVPPEILGKLQVEKTGPGKCDFGSLCPFQIKVTNPTDQPIKATFVAVDEMTRTHDGAVLTNSVQPGEAPGFCTGEGPAGVPTTPLKCTAEIELGPKESKTYTIGITLDDPKLDPGNNANLDPDPNVSFIAAENCILFQIPGTPLKSCTTVALGSAPLFAKFDLAIEKELKQAAAGGMIEGCAPNQPCRFTIKITNNGPGDYIGPMIVKDDMPAGWTLEKWSGPTVCEQKGDVFSCSMAPQTTLAAGQSVEWTVELQPVPSQSDQMVQVKNCAEIDWKGAPGDAKAGNDGPVCATVTIPPVPPQQPTGGGAWSGPEGKAYDLAIEKGPPIDAPGTAAGAGMFYVCEPLKACPFTVTITNKGIDKYDGPFSFTDIPKGGWTYAAVSQGWSCTPAAGDTFTCTGHLSLEPGKSAKIGLELNPMPGVPVDPLQGENCAEIDWKGGPGDANKDNDGPVCTPVILAVGAPKMPGDPGGPGAPKAVGPDLRVRKEANTQTCEPGTECGFNIIIRGTQDFPFKGKFKISDIPPKGWSFAGGGKLGLWDCSFLGCVYDVSKYPGLPSGGFTSSDVLATDIRFKVPPDAKEGKYQNCVFVRFEPPPGGGISKPYKMVCATVQVGYKPKLTIAKHFDKATCAPGEECNFIITLKNEGKGPYLGFLHLWDYEVGSEFLNVGSVSAPGWKCSTKHSAPELTLQHFVCFADSLATGETVIVTAKAKMAADVPQEIKEIENCGVIFLNKSDPKKLSEDDKVNLVRFALQAGGYKMEADGPLTAVEKKAISDYKKDTAVPETTGEITDELLKEFLPTVEDASGKTSIKACVKVSVGKAGLIIDKKGPPEKDFGNWKTGLTAKTNEALMCQDEHQCQFTITVTGNSDAPYTDPIVIEDTSPNGWWTLREPPEGKGWSCTGTTRFTCTHPPVPGGLTKNSTPLKLTYVMEMGKDYIEFNDQKYHGFRHPWWIHNCAKIIYKNAVQYQLQKREEYESCYKLRLGEGKYDLSMYDYDATGTGNCRPPCTFYEFTATMRPRLTKRPAGASAAPAPDYDPTGTGNCLPPNCGAPAAAGAARGGAGYSGPLSMTIKLPPKAQFPNTRITRAPSQCAASGWSCSQSGREFGNAITCRSSRCIMRPGDRVTLRLDGKVAPELTEPPEVEQTREVCGELQYQAASQSGSIEQKVGVETKRACVTTRILARPKPEPVTCPKEQGWKPYPESTALLPGWKLKKFGTGANAIFCMKREKVTDLQVSTAPKGKCTMGQTCAVGTLVSNVGRDVYAESIEVRGKVSPPVSIRSVIPSSGWTCRTTGGGRYTCRGKPVNFAPGASARINLGLAVPRNFRYRQITHSVQIAWPQGKSDANPANDTSIFTIPIFAPTLPPAPPPPEVVTPVPPKAPPARPQPAPPKAAPPRCPDGQVRIRGLCMCPSNRPVWTGRQCIPKPQPAPPKAAPPRCPDGQVRIRGRCVCPPNRPVWTGRQCISKPKPPPPPAPRPCSGGKVRIGNQCVCTGNSVDFRGICTPCPPGKRKVGNRCQRIPPPPAPPKQGTIIKVLPMKPLCPAGQYWNKDAKRCLKPLR